MKTLLVLTTGRSDVQLVEGETYRELDRDYCAALHDEIERRNGEWHLVDSPPLKGKPRVPSLPAGTFDLCAPKLDAVMRYLEEHAITPTAALILETRRDGAIEEARLSGQILERRLTSLSTININRFAFLTGDERYDDDSNARDAIVRREVVDRIDRAVANYLGKIAPDRIVLAASGGFPVINSVIEEIVRLYAPARVEIDSLEVADGAKANPPARDRAVSRRSFPDAAASYQARRHALNLVEKGNLLGAWGAVQHLDGDDVEHRWTRVVKWLADFAASLPISDECDIPVLNHPRMAVQSAIRVELALRAGDIPRAVHGTVAFFESALWDHLSGRIVRHPDKTRRLFRVDPPPPVDLVRSLGKDAEENRRCPFDPKDINGTRWYRIDDSDTCANRLAEHYLDKPSLVVLGKVTSKVRHLRNDVDHNEPTPDLVSGAQQTMVDAQLWSPEGTFLAQPMVQDALRELGVDDPGRLCTELMETVRARLHTV